MSGAALVPVNAGIACCDIRMPEKNHGGNGAKKTQVEKVVDAGPDGLLCEQAAAERGDPTPRKQQVSVNHAHHRESEPFVEDKSGESHSLQRAGRDQQRHVQPEGYFQAPNVLASLHALPPRPNFPC
jgi:hypothetical protein